MEIVRHVDVEEFVALAHPVLAADPLRHTMMLTVLDGLRVDPATTAILLTLHESGVVGAALRTPPWPALVSAVPPPHAEAVEALLGEVDPALPGVAGPTPEAEAFAAARVARGGARIEVDRRMRLFALGHLAHPADVAGAGRTAYGADLELLGAWRRAFADEVDHGWRDALTPVEQVARKLRTGAGELLWEVGGQAVSHAAASAPVAGMSRVGPVYTPPEHRRHGYGGAVTAAASRWALDAGADRVLLFTDLANPTTNALYPQLGYRPVHDAVELRFVGTP